MYGQFEYLVMPMGLCNATATFQTLKNNIFYDCIDEFLVVYTDDLLIFSKNEEDLRRYVEKVLTRLRKHKLYFSQKKCVFMGTEMEFLGFIVGKNGLRVHPKKMVVIENWPRPSSITEVRSFLGLVKFFRRFISRFSEVLNPRSTPFSRQSQPAISPYSPSFLPWLYCHGVHRFFRMFRLLGFS
jgi:Reverse transcriptase (RNA-dependent DNA polymerase)